MNPLFAFKERWAAPQGYAEILQVGLPLVASMASSTVMQFTDRLFLSHYSLEAIAAALPAAMVSVTSMLTVMGVCGYTSVLIAQYVGSGAPRRVGPSLWQGIWSALIGGAILAALWWPAEWLFSLAGHAPAVQALEVKYFRILTLGAVFALLGNSLGAFFSGRGQTRPVMVANILGALLNIPLDYLLIFGGLGLPSLGVAGAALATVAGWILTTVIMIGVIFRRKYEEEFAVVSGWRFQPDMFKRLLRYGLPNSVNLFMELVVISWFIFEVGRLGTAIQAASNIAFSVNSLVFMPMLGMSFAVSTLTGQAMGRGRPEEAERVAVNALHLTLAYMLPVCLFFVLAPGFLLDLFAPGHMDAVAFAPVRAVGVSLLYYIALYSLVDGANLVYAGALKGVGDTLGVMLILCLCAPSTLVLPVLLIKYMHGPSLFGYWTSFTVYIIALALAAWLRFRRKGWHSIRVVETAPPAG